MSSSIVDGTHIDTNLFSYSQPKLVGKAKVINIYNKETKEYFTVAAPMMGAWGAQETKEEDGKGTGKYTMSLQFSEGKYATPEASAFLEELKKVEHQIKKDAMENSKEWFGKEITNMDVMDEKVRSMLKYPKIPKTEQRDYTRPPSLTVKLPSYSGVWQTSVFDEDYNPLYVKGKSDADVTPLTFLQSNTKAPIQIIALIQFAGIWFVGGIASLTWNLKQVIVKKPKTSFISDDTCFLTMRETEREALKALPAPEPVEEPIVSAAIIESDNEDEPIRMQTRSQTAAAAVVEPVPEPEPVAVEVPTPVPAATVPVKRKIVKKQ